MTTLPCLGLTPSGHVVCHDPQHPLAAAFLAGEASGLLQLAGRPGDQTDAEPDMSLVFWRRFGQTFLRSLCQLPDATSTSESDDWLLPPEATQLGDLILNAPPMRGAEYLSISVLQAIWARLQGWTGEQINRLNGISAFLEQHAPLWSRVGKVTVHLAENKLDPDYPFAFMAAYASDLSNSGRLQQRPLGKALQEFAGAGNKQALIKLLEPLHRAAQSCSLMADVINSGDIYHPVVWTPQEAYQFLRHIPIYEAAGLQVRIPNWWQRRYAHRPVVKAVIGEKNATAMGLQTLLDFRLEVELDGHVLTREEIQALLANTEEGLVLFRGQWIEVDRERLQQALKQWQNLADQEGVSLLEGMRLLAGAPSKLGAARPLETTQGWAFAQPGAWLNALIEELSHPAVTDPPASLQADLRPYQAQGLNWLWFCTQMGLGACLADDMGLGKTIQVLAALLRKKEQLPDGPPALLVVPASLIGNWKREITRFAPSLRFLVAHSSEGALATQNPLPSNGPIHLIITTYSMLNRLGWLQEQAWSWVILDEAQAIKNHGTRQSRAVRQLRAQARIALTGTPVENHLGDLWSLFDFINPGLLGNAKQFKQFTKQLMDDAESARFAPLRRLVAPYILRRLKTDRSIIADLPAKTEMKVFCGLSPAQARLYQQTARSLQRELQQQEQGIQRKGLVLSYLLRFKQICNHPDQLQQNGDFAPHDSAKFQRLITLCEEMAERGEKALVFTQFREITTPLESCLAGVFGARGLILHGGIPVKERPRLVEQFQREDGPPFFVLSLKAGGTGLNLTAASQVIHFDRWWNPAVENQATDRAFRIGQQRPVLVHKFVTSGTLEERIDALISDKQSTADAILSSGAEKVLTEMSNEELLDFIRLDLDHAQSE